MVAWVLRPATPAICIHVQKVWRSERTSMVRSRASVFAIPASCRSRLRIFTNAVGTFSSFSSGGSASGIDVSASRAVCRASSNRSATHSRRSAASSVVNGMSLLDAAAHLLSLGTGDPMRCKDIVDLAVARGLWASRNGGTTPANSLHAAMSREIKTKCEASRFVKAERGKFALASKA